MRLATVYLGASLTNAQYRALMPMTMLRSRGHEVLWAGPSHGDLPPQAALRRCHVIHVYRAADPRLLRYLTRLQSAGVAVTWDQDDDLLSLPPEAPNYRLYAGARTAREIAAQQAAARLADVVTTSSAALAERFTDWGAEDVRVVDNYLPPEFTRVPRARHAALTVGWVACDEHLVDFKALALESTIAEMLARYPHVLFKTVGIKLPFHHERYLSVDRVPLAELPNEIGTFDIGIAPLADIAFNRARSTIKAKEYAVAGVPWIGSPVGEYRKLGASHGGTLVRDTGWLAALSRLIEDRRLRAWMGARGRLWARRQTMETQVTRWEDAFRAAVHLRTEASGAQRERSGASPVADL